MAGFGTSSGFGGGGFGNNNNTNNIPPGGGGFGSTGGGAGFGPGFFGGGGGGGFGQPQQQQQGLIPPSVPFGQPQPSTPAGPAGGGFVSGFGSNASHAPAHATFGGGGGGGAPPPFSNNNNNTAPASSSTSGLTFGTSPNVVIHNNNNISNSTTFGGNSGGFGGTGGFGGNSASAAASGFGSSTAPAFSSSNNNNNPFGQPSPAVVTTGSTSSGFNSGFGSGFDGSRSSSSGSGPSGFGSAAAAAAATGGGGLPFGTSTSSSAGFGQQPGPSSTLSASASPWTPGPATGGGGFGNSAGSSSGFGGGGQGGGGFGHSSTTSSSGFGRQQQANPFAPASSHRHQDFGPPDASASDDDMDAGRRGTRSDHGTNREWRRGDGQNSSRTARPGFGDGGMSNSDDEIGDDDDDDDDAIRAKHAARQEINRQLEEKKRRLMEKMEAQKRRKEKDRESGPGNAENGARSPPRSSSPTRSTSPPPPALPMSSSQMGDLSRRNATRFEKKQQPSRATASAESSRSNSPVAAVTESERADLENAVTLVGTCQNMCPDDELARRVEENDIQALEVVLPNVIHPPDWTLRDTAVKRFRRSAADYKLDVPEWVRPPDVLERTISYLEEWIMERDRQGIDPRFRQTNIPPPPLDVYQFIWDRTRMIRKDFTLQNYVGTNGNCDARAVRCHERIARWHALCEHQLSHLDDFVKAQSSQNITELGQTLKTLNELYGDSLNRSTVEVADEDGGETRNASERNRYREGCRSDTVQGPTPIDYDGKPLNNEDNNPMAALRLIGMNPNILNLPAHGTAEPEMRALYILLTVNNEGGMEVLKYAARLFKDRPAVYHSPLVQLALKIFKAIRDDNYAQFFSIMRSDSTPYLFCCIMFSQYVTRMRKTAIRTMAATYGGRTADGQTGHDLYQLGRLVNLLCYEDADEARNACKFYNITVVKMELSDGNLHDIISWKSSKFKEPTDPIKGTLLTLYPRKMTRTIEKKLHGATRLAICRGEVSGEGAALSAPLGGVSDSSVTAVSDDARAKAKALLDRQRKDLEILQKQQQERDEKERKQKLEKAMQEEKRREEEQTKKKKEQKRLEELDARRKEQEAIEQRRIDQERQRKEEELDRERARKEQEAALEKARIEAEQERARLEAEEARKKQEIEEQRRRKEAERIEKERQLRKAEEERKREIEEKRRREAEEARRREEARRELEARLKREAEDRRKTEEWRSEIDCATKLVAWRRWRRALSLQIERKYNSRLSLDLMEKPIYANPSDYANVFQTVARNEPPTIQMPQMLGLAPRDILEQLLRQSVHKFSIANMALDEVERSMDQRYLNPRLARQKMTLLLKIAIIIPVAANIADESWASLIASWVESRLTIGVVDQARLRNCEVRSVVVNSLSYQNCHDCDVALFVIPPSWAHPDGGMSLCSFGQQMIRESTPRLALVLPEMDAVGADYREEITTYVAGELNGESHDSVTVLIPSAQTTAAYHSAFKVAMERCVETYVNTNCLFLSRVPIIDLACKTVVVALQKCVPLSATDGDETLCLECARETLSLLVRELSNYANQNKELWKHLPQSEFISEDGVVPSFFSEVDGLPQTWSQSLNHEFLVESIAPIAHKLHGHFEYVFRRLLSEAPTVFLDDCATLYAHGLYRSCLEKSIIWTRDSSSLNAGYLYLPFEMADDIIDVVTQTIQDDQRFHKSKRPLKGVKLHPRTSPGTSIVPAEVVNFGGHENAKSKKRSRMSTSDSIEGVREGRPVVSDENENSVGNLEKRCRKIQTEVADDGTEIAKMSSRSPPSSQTRERPNLKSLLAAELEESKSFSNRLDDLLNGDATADLAVGGTTLRRLLRGVHNYQPRGAEM